MKAPFLGQTYPSRSTNIAADRTINFFPELSQPDSKSILSLIGTPGTVLWASLGASPIRGMHVVGSTLYVVAGAYLYSISTAGVISNALGTLNTSSGRVSMADNGVAAYGIGGNQLIIADGVSGYVYNTLSGTFVNTSVNGLSHLCYIDSYFIAVAKNSMAAYCCDPYDGTTWQGLSVAQISGSSDTIQTVMSLNQQVWFIKQNTSEVWYDAAVPTSSGFPFARISGGVIDFGTPAPWSVARSSSTILMLGNIRSGNSGEFVGVIQVSGYTATPISPPPITYQMSKWPTFDDAFGYCYSSEGHTFYVITSPSGNQTFVYDLTTQLWHERSTYTDSPYAYARHISNAYCFFNGRHYVGDWQSGNIYEMNSSTYTDNGQPIISVRIAQHMFDSNTLDYMFFHKLYVDTEGGFGGNTEPYVMLSWSDDGAHTWSSDYLASMGKTGRYTTRLVWRRLGYARDRVFRLAIGEPVKKVVIAATVEISE